MSVLRGRYKKEAYEQAIVFRKRGFTYTEIAKICAVSRGTISKWLALEPFSQAAAKSNKKQAAKDNKERINLINKARNVERANKYREILHLAETEFRNYRNSPLFVAGLTIYLAEGNLHDPRVIRLSSSKTELQQIFIRFVVEYLGVERPAIRFWLLLYPDHDEIKCMKHWSKKTGISVGQFYKNQVVLGRSNNTTLHFGVGNTIIGNVLLKKKLVHWTELLSKELIK